MSERCGPDSDSMPCYDRVASESASKNRGCYLRDSHGGQVSVFLPLFPPHSVPHLPRLRRMMERRRRWTSCCWA